MSRGLGKIQRKILNILNNGKETDCLSLGQRAFDCVDELGDPIRLKGGEWWQHKEVTDSQWQSLWRAIRGLKKKGMIETRQHKFTGKSNDYPFRHTKEIEVIDLVNGGWKKTNRKCQGGQSSYKIIKCLVHGTTSNELNTYTKREVSA